jgi:hypothetical protein
MLSPSLVILSEAKNLRSSLRVNSAKHLCSSSQVLEARATAEILLPRLRDQDDSPSFFSHLLSPLGGWPAVPMHFIGRQAG